MDRNDNDNDIGNDRSVETIDLRYAVEAADYILSEVEKILRTMRRLAKWAADADLSNKQREILQKEIDRLKGEIDSTFAMLTGPPTLKN
jgi:flagellin-like hook-associated protein FlgL